MEEKARLQQPADPLRRRPPPASDPRRRGVPEDRVLDLVVATGLAHHAAEDGPDAARGLAAEALDRWAASGLAHEIDARGARRFDPMEVINGFKWAGLQGQDGFWRDHSIPMGRRLTRERAQEDPEGRAPVRAVFTRSFDLADVPAEAGLLLRAPLPLDGPDHALASLDLDAPEAAIVDDGRITLRLNRRPAASVTLGWTATLAPAAAPSQTRLGAEEAELYLRPVEGFIRAGPRVRELASLWAAGRTGWDAATAFRRRLGEAFCMGTIGYEAFDPDGAMDWVLDHGWFDCVLGSALLVSLCRAYGLPARLVSGHHLFPLHPSDHAWAEVWDEGHGWKPIDLAGWDLSAGDSDPDWRDVFTGRVDRRLVTERPPRRVTGPMSPRLPRAWRLLHRLADGGGLEVLFVDAASGRTLFTDRLRVTFGRTGWV